METNNYYPGELIGKAEYMLDEYELDGKKTGVVIINTKNVSKVLAMISTDSAYRKAMDKSAEGTNSFNGSSAYWFDRIIQNSNNCSSIRDAIYHAIIAIDNENSTHLNAVKNKGGVSDDIRRLMADRIKESQVIETLIKYLKNPDSVQPENVFESIACEIKGRTNPSFASKFCHFFAKAVCEESDEFPIYDSVLFRVLPRYAVLYSIPEPALLGFNKGCNLQESYKAYIELVSALSERSFVSKTGLDQLLWYYYKGRSIPQKETFEKIKERLNP